MIGALWFWAAVALYGVAALLYFGFLLGAPGRIIRVASVFVAAGFVAHTIELGARGIAGSHPVTSIGDAVGFSAWLIVAAFSLARLRYNVPGMGAFVAPTAAVLLVAARFSPAGSARESVALGILGRVHISLVALGVAMFAVAAGAAILYLVGERSIKHKHLGVLFRKGASLETLDTVVHRCVLIGFPVYTVAMVTGVWWTIQSSLTMRPQYILSMAVWVAFGVLLLARLLAGWRGRRAALITLGGFVAVVAVLLIYWARAKKGA